MSPLPPNWERLSPPSLPHRTSSHYAYANAVPSSHPPTSCRPTPPPWRPRWRAAAPCSPSARWGRSALAGPAWWSVRPRGSTPRWEATHHRGLLGVGPQGGRGGGVPLPQAWMRGPDESKAHCCKGLMYTVVAQRGGCQVPRRTILAAVAVRRVSRLTDEDGRPQWPRSGAAATLVRCLKLLGHTTRNMMVCYPAPPTPCQESKPAADSPPVASTSAASSTDVDAIEALEQKIVSGGRAQRPTCTTQAAMRH